VKGYVRKRGVAWQLAIYVGLDEHHWTTRDQFAKAIVDSIETWSSPRRDCSYCDKLSCIDYDTQPRHDHHNQPVQPTRKSSFAGSSSVNDGANM
jgi:hypothetical protein